MVLLALVLDSDTAPTPDAALSVTRRVTLLDSVAVIVVSGYLSILCRYEGWATLPHRS